MKKILLTVAMLILWLSVSQANTLSFPAGLTGTFPAIDQNYSTIHFHIQNNFNGVFLWRANKTLSTPVTVTIGATTISGCTQQLQWLYYNNQRGFRLRPIDQNTLTGMQNIDPSYNALSLTGWLFTNCSWSGVSSQNVYGALGHIRGWHTYRIIGGVSYDFANKTWTNVASWSWTKLGNSATGWIFDSQWAIWQLLASFQCGNIILESGEQCDDWNQNNNDWCSSQCTFEIPQTCGLSGNLVPNPWFESYLQCPTDFAHFTWYTASWYSPSPNADYIRMGCPFGSWMFNAFDQYPHAGSSWATHILTYSSNIPWAGREYIWAELVTPMQIGKTYNVWFCYATTAISNYISDKIGILFSTGSYPTNTGWNAITQTPQFEHTWYIVWTWWTCVSGTVLADKAYERFTIGSFHTNSWQSIIANPMWNSGVAVPWYDIASYLIDDVFVSEACDSAPTPYCGDGIINGSEQCDGTSNCTSSCTLKSSWGGGWITIDYCPNGDFSSSYYDRTCGTAPIVHSAAPVGKACKYEDEKYLANGSFTDTIGHRWFPYSEIMRVSCVHRWVGTKQGLWIYAPNANVTRAEVLKTVVKILGIEFDNFTILNEDLPYVAGNIPFADVASGNWFAHYANYAYTQWLTEWLYTTDKDGNKFFNPDKPINRYEAIKVIMLAYKKINKQSINTNKPSVLSDIVNSNDPYYSYVREAETLWFISGSPQTNGTYTFDGQDPLTRAAFAKIVSVPFAQQLFDVEDVVTHSKLYIMIVEALSKTTSDKVVFINTLFNRLNSMTDVAFMKAFTLDKKTFLDVLKERVMLPILQ